MKRYILITLLILPFVSCEDFLKEIPKDRLSEANFYTTLEEAESAVNAIYDPIRWCFDNPYLIQQEVPADYAYGRGSTLTIGGEYTGLDATNISRVGRVWTAFYKAINYANIAIEKIPEIDADESSKAVLVTEARFLRAFCYYYLVRNWSAVPLRLDTKGEDLARTPENEVYDAIISDLEAAEDVLPSTTKFGRPSKWAAKALLAEVYLTTENWELAKEKAVEVIKSGQFSLVEIQEADDFNKLFGSNANGTEEEIFYLKYSHENGTKWPYYFLWKDITFSNFGGYVIYSYLDNPFIVEWDDNDLRKQFDIFTEYISKTTGLLTQLPDSYPVCFSKYRDTDAPSKGGHANDYHALRYADVLLTYAEAASQSSGGPTADAIESLNKIKRRAYGA